jgi:putative Holliday junction resolvase
MAFLWDRAFCSELQNRAVIMRGNVPERVLALDLGKRRIGLAVSDELGLTAQGLPTLHRTTIREDLDSLKKLAAERAIGRIVIGLPLRTSGEEGRQAAWVRDFGRRIEERTGLPVEYWDERFTSVEAGRVLRSSGISIEKRAKAIDRLAAVLILNGWLEHRRHLTSPFEGGDHHT